MDLLPRGLAESLLESAMVTPWQEGRQAAKGPQTQEPLRESKAKGFPRGGQKEKVMPLKHTRGPF